MDYLKEAVIAHWGDKCSEYEPQCHCCIAWLQYETAIRALTDLHDLAARYDQLLEHHMTKMAEVGRAAD